MVTGMHIELLIISLARTCRIFVLFYRPLCKTNSILYIAIICQTQNLNSIIDIYSFFDLEYIIIFNNVKLITLLI